MEVVSVVRLSPQDREEISRGLAAGLSCRLIARGLGRDHSVVSREVARNRGRHGYRGERAQVAAAKRSRRPKTRKLVACPVLAAVVEAGLGLRGAPRPSGARVRGEVPPEEGVRISPRTIYRAVYVQGRGRAAENGDPRPR